MSRKSNADKSTWKTASIYAFHHGYGPFKPKAQGAIVKPTILLVNDSQHQGKALLRQVAGDIQSFWMHQQEETDDAILVLDLSELSKSDGDDSKENLSNQTKSDSSPQKSRKKPRKSKKIAASDTSINPELMERAILRLLERMHVREATLVASGDLGELLLLLAMGPLQQSKFVGCVDEIQLVRPNLSAKFVNQYLTTTQEGNNVKVKVYFSDNASRDKRLPMIQHVFPNVEHQVLSSSSSSLFLACNGMQDYDETWIDQHGKSLFLSQLTCEMNRYTKQYETSSVDVTSSLLPETKQDSTAKRTIDWTKCPEQVGGLVLRGNRCVLVRSLQGKWQGMRIPSVDPRNDDASPQDTAVRSIVELCGVDSDEVQTLPGIAPIYLYDETRGVKVVVYPLYASQPPPDGPLENADMEDDQTNYDWYTFENALRRLKLDHGDPSCYSQYEYCLVTMASTLRQARHVGLLPNKWGGVFGQEYFDSSIAVEMPTDNVTEHDKNNNSHGTPTTASTNGSKAGEHSFPEQALHPLSSMTAKTDKRLPVTILSGFLGAGKTTMMSHILTNVQGLKVAILVNDMGDVNIDASLLAQVSIHERKEHLIELTNGCICCTLREDLLVEIKKLANQGEFDFLLVESSGISEPMQVAETSTFEDDLGQKLDDVATIDAMITVVDGSSFYSELQNLDTLRQRDWHEDPEDQRTIAHLLCDQIEFANIVVLNKLDMMDHGSIQSVKNLLREMNPTARLLESTFSAVPLDQVFGTGLFSMKQAEEFDGWCQEARIGEHTPETEEYGISSFTYRAFRPFHPQRLVEVLDAWLEQTDTADDTTGGSTILRAKGYLWLVHSSELQGEYSLAGNQYSILPGNPWWAMIDRCDWPEGLQEAISPLWHEPHGDRQQEVVIIGQDLNKSRLVQALDSCLCSFEEMNLAEKWPRPLDDDPTHDLWNAALEMRAIKEEDGHGHDHS